MTNARQVPDGLTPEAYATLHELARALMRGERANHTLQPTALVHEAYLRMRTPAGAGDHNDERVFRARAATTMRHILVDHARRHTADKRGGGWVRVELPEAAVDAPPALELVALDDALRELAALDERKARVVELRFFGGLSTHETADVLGIAHSTADADWAMARAWLRKKLEGGE